MLWITFLTYWLAQKLVEQMDKKEVLNLKCRLEEKPSWEFLRELFGHRLFQLLIVDLIMCSVSLCFVYRQIWDHKQILPPFF